MKTILAAVAMTAASLTLGACATITRGTNTAWEVKTDPPGARVKTTNGFACASTPCSLKMPRKAEFTATITKEGYKPLDVQVTHKVSGGGGAGMAGNVLVGGLIGVGVDATSGAMLDLTPNPVSVTLEKLPAEAPPVATPAEHVAVLADTPTAAPAAPAVVPEGSAAIADAR